MSNTSNAFSVGSYVLEPIYGLRCRVVGVKEDGTLVLMTADLRNAGMKFLGDQSRVTGCQ